MVKKHRMVIKYVDTAVAEDITESQAIDPMGIDFHSMSKAQLQEYADTHAITSVNHNTQSKDMMITELLNHLNPEVDDTDISE